MTASDLDTAMEAVGAAVAGLPPRGQAGWFWACGTALFPLYQSFRTETGWGDEALLVRGLEAAHGFATGTDGGDVADLLDALSDAAPHGDDFDAPASTYAQDVVICVDAAVRAIVEPGDGRRAFFAFEPLLTALTERDLGVLSAGDEDAEWRRRIARDPRLVAALRFAVNAAQRLRRPEGVDEAVLQQLAAEAAVLRPHA